MPHQCVRCGTFYSDGAQEILQGCQCGARVFFYIKKSKLQKAKKITKELSVTQKKEIEKSVTEIANVSHEGTDPVVLDFEAINVSEPGKFEIDLVNLFNKENPVVYKLEEGKYMIDLPESFKREKEEN